jgi:tetratricopeptide (TPR) repeat protein
MRPSSPHLYGLSRRPSVRATRAPRALAAAAACGLWLWAGAAAALGDTGERALRLAREGRCAAALPELDAARAAAPSPAERFQLALRAGQCRMRLHRYAEAVRDLSEATRLVPESGEAQLGLARAGYHARDLQVARRALDVAERLLPDDAEVALYRGMLQIEAGDDAAAIASLERARALDAERVEPVASLQLAMARARTRDTKRAEAELQRVADAWRGTDWSTRADQELARLRAGRRRHAWVALGAGIEHDSNVVLRGRGIPAPADISDDADWRGVWLANGGAQLWKGQRATLGAMASYRGTSQFDLHAFDAHFPSATTWLDVELSPDLLANARYDFGYAWLDGDPFVATHSWQLALQRASGAWGSSQLHVRTHLDDYFFDSDDVPDATGATCGGPSSCGPAGLDERSERRRSGWGLETGIGHALPIDTGSLPLHDLSLRAEYEFGLFESRGREYTYQSHALRAGVSARLPFAVGADLSGAYTWRPFRHPSTYPDPPLPANGSPYVLSGVRRRERMLELEAVLSRALTEQLSVSARWRYVDNRSNRDVFDYEQQVFGLYVSLAMGREI